METHNTRRTRTAIKLMKEISPQVVSGHAKVTVVGCGQVGMAAAFSMLTLGVCSDLALCNRHKDIVVGEQKDLLHGLAFLGRQVHVAADSDFSISRDSRVIIITIGARQKEGETRLDLVQKNVEIFKGIVPELVKYSPDAVIVVVTNPCDIMAWVTWKLSGLPKHRVFASGTMLDTSRFRHVLAERFNVAAHNVHGYILGEHGDSSVPVWSNVRVAGTRLRDIFPIAGESPYDHEQWEQLHHEVVNAAYEIIKLKGYTSWGIGITTAKLVEAILKNQRSVFTLSTLPEGWNGISEEVFLSIPVCIGEKGITHLVSQKLNEAELAKVQQSAKTLRAILQEIELT